MLKISLKHTRTAIITVALAAATLSTGCAIDATEPVEDTYAGVEVEDELVYEGAYAEAADEMDYVDADQDQTDELERQPANGGSEVVDVRVVAADRDVDDYGPGEFGDEFEEQGQINPGGPVAAR